MPDFRRPALLGVEGALVDRLLDVGEGHGVAQRVGQGVGAPAADRNQPAGITQDMQVMNITNLPHSNL